MLRPTPLRPLASILAAVSLAAALAAPAAAAPPVAQEIDWGVPVFEADPPEAPPPGDFDALFRLLDERRSFPVHAELLTRFIGATATGTRGLDEVRNDLTRLLELTLLRYNPEDPLTVFDRAFVSMHVATYNYDHFPSRVFALTALADFTNLLATNPLNPWLHLFYTVVYATVREQNVSDFKRFDPLDELKKALSFDYKNAWFHFLVGQTFLAVSQGSAEVHELAFAEFQAALRIDPDNTKLADAVHAIHLKLLQSYEGRDERKPYWLEQVVYERILKQDPKNAAARNNLGFLYARGGRNLTEAVELTAAALAAEPDNPAYLDSHGFALARAGRAEEGLPLLERAHALNPEDTDTIGHLADLHLMRNENAKAVPYLRKMLAKDPKNELYNNNLAYTLSELNQDLDEALKMVNLALEFSPGNPVYLDTKGWIYFKLGMPEKALPLLDEAIAKEPGLGAVYIHRGDIHFFMGRLDAALEQYRLGIRLEPEFPGAADHLARLTLIRDLSARLTAAGKNADYASLVKAPFDYPLYAAVADALLERLGVPKPPAGKPGTESKGGAAGKPAEKRPAEPPAGGGR